jgi:hypothetical protein
MSIEALVKKASAPGASAKDLVQEVGRFFQQTASLASCVRLV